MKLRLVRADARSDPHVEKAIALMRAALDARWTVARLRAPSGCRAPHLRAASWSVKACRRSAT